MYYILFYALADDYLERRTAFRKDHLAYAEDAHKRGEIKLAGALAEPADKAVFVFKTESPEMVENFARNDPYVLNGLVKEWEVRPWTVVIGS